MQNILFTFLVVVTALGGLSLASYIHYKKKRRQPITCPLDSDCDTVVHSEYAYFLGLPVELLGMFYYGLIAVVYGAFLFAPAVNTSLVVFLILGASIVAFFFSLYLTFVQAVAIKEWCTWCLISAGLSTLVLLFSLAGLRFGLIALLEEYQEVVKIMHLFGIALGVGGATIANVFFFKFLKDLRISENEADNMRTLSQVIWFALAVLVLSGIGTYLPHFSALNASSNFLVKTAALAVLVAVGAVLNIFIAPRLVRISFGAEHDHEPGELHRARKFAFALGVISLLSWYAVFVLSVARAELLSTFTLFLLYALTLVIGVIASQLIERSFSRRSMQ